MYPPHYNASRSNSSLGSGSAGTATREPKPQNRKTLQAGERTPSAVACVAVNGVSGVLMRVNSKKKRSPHFMHVAEPAPSLRPTILAFHKPRGLTVEQGSAPNHGAPGRKRTLNDYLRELEADHSPNGRLFAVGRLDKETTGLLLITDDGRLSERVLRPGMCSKVYEATVKLRAPACCDAPKLARLLEGIELSDGMARADAVEMAAAWIEHPEPSRQLRNGPRNAKRWKRG